MDQCKGKQSVCLPGTCDQVCRGVYLQAAQADHAVHHLSDTETVTEVVEGIVLVVVVNTKLQREKDSRREFTWRSVRAGGER